MADERASAVVCIVYHSRAGRTRVLAEAVARGASEAGARVHVISVEDVEGRWDDLAAADAIIFGCPTFMGSASAPFKAFMDASYKVWAVQGWRDKIAAGFTNSSAPSGDKLSTLMQLAVFAAQHSMIWVNLGVMPALGYESDQLNRLGAHLGAMAQSAIGVSPERTPPIGDRETAAQLGRRVAEAAARWSAGGAALAQGIPLAREPHHEGVVQSGARAGNGAEIHPTARTWQLPPPDRAPLAAGLRRTNLRSLAARPSRFEHHLLVVARVGGAQLECVTASEPLAFAHANISDEYAIALPVGDPLIDGFPLRTFFADLRTGADVARINHRISDLVLHPHGYLHWPGRLRPPYEPFAFPPGMRRTGLSMVYCASSPCEPGGRPLAVPSGREADVKAYGAEPVPFSLVDTRAGAASHVATVADSHLDLVVSPREIALPRGGYVVIIEAEGAQHLAADLVYVPPAGRLETSGVTRALVFSSDSAVAEPPPPSWDALFEPPMAPFESGPRLSMPVDIGALHVEELSPTFVRARVGSGAPVDVPRHWLARMLFRVALHDYRLGYVETYGGFYWDDRTRPRIGIRDGGEVSLAEGEVASAIETLYRSVAPEGYRERID